MIIYSVTVNIDTDVEADWLEWMTKTHIPDVLNTGYFRDSVVRKEVIPESRDGATTYRIEYSCETIEDYDRYRANAAEALQRDHSERYEGRFTASRCILEDIEAHPRR